MPDTIYICAQGETFDLVALKVYGDEKYASLLLAENPELCHLMTFRGSERIVVPALEEEGKDETAPWKR